MKGIAFPQRGLRLVAGLLLGLLAGCSAQSRMDFYSKDIACEELGQQWSMPDSHGTVRGPKDLQGQVTYLFFGFTSCPDVCPTTMVELSQVKHLMGKDADQLQVVFVSVDPARDTPEVARTYVEAFDPRAIALVGNEAQLAAMASDFKAFYEKEPGQVPDTYTMSHIAGGYVFDRQGRLRLFAPYGMPVDELFSDVQRLLLEPGHPAAGNDALASCHLKHSDAHQSPGRPGESTGRGHHSTPYLVSSHCTTSGSVARIPAVDSSLVVASSAAFTDGYSTMAWPEAFDTFTTVPPVAVAARWAEAASVKNTLTRDVATTGAPSRETAAANLPAPASAGAAAAPSSERLVRALVVAAACGVIVN